MKFKSLLCAGIVLLLAGLLPANAPARARPVEPPEAMIDAPGGQEATGRLWSSDWEIILPGNTRTFTHDLGGNVEDYQVQLWFLDLPAGGYGINNFGYGGIEADGFEYGAYWQNLTPTTIDVVREPVNGTADRVRVSIWRPSPAPDVCTTWLDATPSDFTQAVHQLGGDPEEYVMSLWFKDTDPNPDCINQHGYGGLEVAGVQRGGYWANPTVSYVPVYRNPGDPYADQVRVCVDVPDDPPAYNSDWRTIAAGTTLTLTHGVGGNVYNYILDVEFKDLEALGVHIVGMGGNFFDPALQSAEAIEQGAHWQRLTGSTIEVVRQENDLYVDQVRVRIWERKMRVFLPLVMKG